MSPDQPIEPARACAQQAIAENVPFRVGVEGMAFDSYAVDVLVGSAGGKLTWLRLDSDTSGGSRFLPRPKLLEWPCSGVTFTTEADPGRLFFRCEIPAPSGGE